MCNCGKKCESSCETKCCIKKCTLPTCVIRAEKTLLNLSFIEDGYTSGPDFCATFEIVLFNDTAHKIKNVSIIDSLLGLNGDLVNPITGGELRPHYTNVDILSHHPTLFPLTFEQIILNGGELLDTTLSYLDPCSVTVLKVRIAGNGVLVAVNPTSNDPTGTERFKYTSLLQNTAVIRGDVAINGSEIIKMFPVYVKSGVFTGAITTIFSFNGGNP